jgi:adenosine kinase
MKILLTGSVAFDYLMTFPGYFRDHILPDHLESISLSFLVESMVRMRGGIAPNIAYTLALLGERPYLWATVGDDFEEYRAWLDSKGVDTSGVRVVPGEFTASFFVNTDRSNAQIASFYPGAMAYASQLSLHELEENRPDLVVISPNDPAAMISYVRECKEMGLAYIFDPSQQIVRLEAHDLCEGILGALALFVNDYECALIQKMTGLEPKAILAHPDARPDAFIVITNGKDGATVYTRDTQVHVPIVSAERILDPTGVGDAFRGGFLTGFAHGMDFETCARMGTMAATYCIEQRGPQGQSYSAEEFVVRYRQHYGDSNRLDVLLHS